MEEFTDPYPFYPYAIQREDAKFSPDNRLFAVVTQHGLIAPNELESIIWVFDVKSVNAFLADPINGKMPKPRIVAKMAAATNDLSVVQLKWIENNKLAFLGRDGTSEQSLFTVSLKTGVLAKLTPKGQDVTRYDIASNTVIYTVSLPSRRPKNSTQVILTGTSILPLLNPESPDDFTVLAKPAELWCIRNDRAAPIVNLTTGKPIHLMTEMLSLSPSGHFVAVTQHVDQIPVSWEAYQPFPGPLSNIVRLKSTPARSASQEDILYTLGMPEQYAVLDLHTGKFLPIDAPLGETLDYFTPKEAIWTRDSDRLILLNTYLPLTISDSDEKQRRARTPCVAFFDRISGDVSCIAAVQQSEGESFSKNGLAYRLSELTWNDELNELVLSYTTYGNENKSDWTEHPPNTYRLENGIWVQAKTEPPNRPPFWTGIVQDLNDPPALFIRSWERGTALKLWDPNPQLQNINLGDVSVYRWRDKNNREWVGGLVKPPNYTPGRRYPLVVQTHGFNKHEFMTVGPFATAFAARPLAAVGIMVLQVEEQQDVAFTPQEAPVNAEGYESAVESLSAAGMVDPTRIGAIGFSRTGYYVLEALTTNPRLFAVATIADSDFLGYVQRLLDVDSDRYDGYKAEGIDIYGSQPFGEGLKNWIQKAPAFNFDKVVAPVRIEVHDLRTLVNDWELYASLRLQLKPVDLIQLPDATHEVTKPLERLASEQGDVDWFDFWLNGHEGSDPDKADQYKRWHQLRDMQEPSRTQRNQIGPGPD